MANFCKSCCFDLFGVDISDFDGIISEEDILTGDKDKVRVLNAIRNNFNSQITFDAILEQTKLDVSSKKQWLYVWGSAIILILTIKFYIMSLKK